MKLKHVDLPQDMQRAMARQAEAEREKRAKIIHAEGELVASEQNSTIVFPLPLDLLRVLSPKG